jgi:hypothetical protein
MHRVGHKQRLARIGPNRSQRNSKRILTFGQNRGSRKPYRQFSACRQNETETQTAGHQDCRRTTLPATLHGPSAAGVAHPSVALSNADVIATARKRRIVCRLFLLALGERRYTPALGRRFSLPFYRYEHAHGTQPRL